MRRKFNAEELLERYRSGKCTEQEKAIVESWHLEQLKSSPDKHVISDMDDAKERMLANIRSRSVPVKTNKYSWLYYAASMLVIGLLTFIYTNKVDKKPAPTLIAKSNVGQIVPGSNKATLTLADHSQVILDQAMGGVIATQGSTTIRKTAKGEILYEGTATANQNSENVITVPRGGSYSLTLSDGTKVWLNSASSMRFPVAFKSSERNVYITGEAYFEVAKDKKRPFRVITDKQTIEVLGTHFNVNAYADENTSVTTLLEGMIRITKGEVSKVLKPGQQARNSTETESIDIKTVSNAAAFVDWKNGFFSSSQESIYSVMKKISRWYDVDVQYRGNFDDKHFGGTISRFKNVTEVLKILELTGSVHFKIEGRTIIVMQ